MKKNTQPIYISLSIHHRLKLLCALRKQTISDFSDTILTSALDELERSPDELSYIPTDG